MKTPEGRLEILRRAADVFFHFTQKTDRRPPWAAPFIVRILAPNSTVPCREKFIERVVEPNRQSIDRLITAYCPGLPEEDVVILNLNLFATSMFHYELTYNLKKPLPFDAKITPSHFYEKVKNLMVKGAWLLLEQTRKECLADR